jgi:hypothetical protein
MFQDLMLEYRVEFLDHGDNVRGRDWFEAKDDGTAIAHACRAYRSGIGKGFELWQGERRIHKELNA